MQVLILSAFRTYGGSLATTFLYVYKIFNFLITFSSTLEKPFNLNRVRAEKSIKDFAILDRYKFNKDYAAEIITKSHLYTGSAINRLMEGFNYQGKSVFSSEEEIVETLMGNYLRRGHQHKRVLSKLSMDICSEFGITL